MPCPKPASRREGEHRIRAEGQGEGSGGNRLQHPAEPLAHRRLVSSKTKIKQNVMRLCRDKEER